MESLRRAFTRTTDAYAMSSAAAPPPPTAVAAVAAAAAAPARVVRRQFQSLARERACGCDPCDFDAVALYEVEFPPSPPGTRGPAAGQQPLGIDLETDFYGAHAVVKRVRSSSPAAALSPRFVRPGHVVVAVNGADLSTASFEQVVQALRTARSPRVLRFLDPEVLPLDAWTHEPTLANRDEYGFAKDEPHILNYRRRMRQRQRSDYRCELDWAEFIDRWGGLGRIEALLHRQEDVAGASDSIGSTLKSAKPSDPSTLQLELRGLVMRGVPAVLRAQVWAALANVSAYRSRFPADHFAQLTQRPLPAATLEDIDKDIARTYPEHAFFRSARGQDELRTLLAAYALHNPGIGYCQAMNFLAGMLLVLADVERAFWLLCALLRDDADDGAHDAIRSRTRLRLLPAANYSRSMVGMQADQLVFRSLVRRELPAVAARSDAHGLHVELFTLHWFLCAFVCTLPTASALRVWDWLFLDGQEVLFTTAIGVLKLAEPRILAAASAPELLRVVKALGTDLHDDDALLTFLQQISSPGATAPVVEAVGEQLQGGQAIDASAGAGAVERVSRWLPLSRRMSRSLATPVFTKSHTLEDIERLRSDFRKKLAHASFSSLQAGLGPP